MSQPAVATDPLAPRVATAVGILTLVLLASTQVFYFTSLSRREAAVPSSAAFAGAAGLIDASLQPNDAIAFVPGWAATERWQFERVYRDHGLDFAAAWMPGDPPDSWDMQGFTRVWLVRATELADVTDGTDLGEVIARHAFNDGLELVLIALRPQPVALDLRLALAKATVERVGPDPAKRETCLLQGDRHICAGTWWTHVFAGMHEVGQTRRRCIFMQPHPDGATLRLRWADVPPARRLEGRFGNRLWALRYDKGGDVALRIRVGRTIRHEQVISRDDVHWYRFGFDLQPQDVGKPLTIELSAADTAWRQTCFDARLLGPAPGEATDVEGSLDLPAAATP